MADAPKGAEADEHTCKGAEAGEDSGNRPGTGREAGEVAAAKGAEQQAPDQQQMQRSFKAMAAKYKCQAEKTRRRAREMTRLVQTGKSTSAALRRRGGRAGQQPEQVVRTQRKNTLVAEQELKAAKFQVLAEELCMKTRLLRARSEK